MIRIRNMNLDVFIQCQYIRRNLLRNKNMGESLFKKYSKFQNFDEILYCGMTIFRDTNLMFLYNVSMKTDKKKKKYGQSLLKEHSKF